MDNSGQKIKLNIYFDGQVQSLGLETSKGHATLGNIAKFSTLVTQTT